MKVYLLWVKAGVGPVPLIAGICESRKAAQQLHDKWIAAQVPVQSVEIGEYEVVEEEADEDVQASAD